MANYASSALAGAGTGAAAGSVAGPWGALIGAGVGTLAGLFSAYEQEQDSRRKQEILDRIKGEFNISQDEVMGLLDQYYSNPENFLGTEQDVKDYRAALAEYNPDDFVYNFKEFDYDKSIDDFVNPYYDKIIDATSNKVQHSAAGAGVGRGTGAASSTRPPCSSTTPTVHSPTRNGAGTSPPCRTSSTSSARRRTPR